MHYRDLRDFIAQLQSQGGLRRISAPVSPHLEMTALADRGRSFPGGAKPGR